MDNLPHELVHIILNYCLENYRSSKNQALQLRLVSKQFDKYLSPFVLKTIQLEFSKFLTEDGPRQKVGDLENVGHLSQALYCDLMVIRDEEEIERLMRIFQTVVHEMPELENLLQSLRQFCMREETFDDSDYKRVIAEVLTSLPNLTRLKLNLPFQVIGKASRTATILLACTFAGVASRSPSSKPLEVLVLDHVSDSTILNICNNPVDLSNARRTFAHLKNCVISIKRQESTTRKRILFTYILWDLIGQAKDMESLCLIGWNTKRSGTQRVERLDRNVQADDWYMKGLDYPSKLMMGQTFPYRMPVLNLRCLELKRIDIEPHAFIRLIDGVSTSLKELYLNEVHLKIRGPSETNIPSRWIGHAPEQTRLHDAVWIAEYIRDHEFLKLDVLRATDLGYDDMAAWHDWGFPDVMKEYDLTDPSGNARSFDLRFVERAMRVEPPSEPIIPDLIIPGCPSQEESPVQPPDPSDPETSSPKKSAPKLPPAPRHSYEVEAYQQTQFPYLGKVPEKLGPLSWVQLEQQESTKVLTPKPFSKRVDNNTTSHFKRTIDGIFFNHNERALSELQKIIAVVDQSMGLLSREIDRMSREAEQFRRDGP